MAQSPLEMLLNLARGAAGRQDDATVIPVQVTVEDPAAAADLSVLQDRLRAIADRLLQLERQLLP
ncbi:MAG: hypothetical protein ACOYMY_11930 [Prochlorococcaceae cyanobacterium]|jgi:hypothetical protein